MSVESPRAKLLASFVKCLESITTDDGYNTDAGDHVTTKSCQDPGEGEYVLGVVIAAQRRSDDPAKVKNSRNTTVGIVVKFAVDIDDREERLDLVLQDIERAMNGHGAMAHFEAGYEFPKFQEMKPIAPDASLGIGWSGAVVSYTSHIPIQ